MELLSYNNWNLLLPFITVTLLLGANAFGMSIIVSLEERVAPGIVIFEFFFWGMVCLLGSLPAFITLPPT